MPWLKTRRDTVAKRICRVAYFVLQKKKNWRINGLWFTCQLGGRYGYPISGQSCAFFSLREKYINRLYMSAGQLGGRYPAYAAYLWLGLCWRVRIHWWWQGFCVVSVDGDRRRCFACGAETKTPLVLLARAPAVRTRLFDDTDFLLSTIVHYE